MNRLLFTFSLFVVSACEQSLDRSDLVGIWVSDKDMTLSHIQFTSSEADIKRHATLDGMLGEMAYVFRETGTTFTPVDTIDQQEQWFTWELLESNKKVFVVNANVNGENKKFEFLKQGGCIGVQVEVSDFVEYFCKRS